MLFNYTSLYHIILVLKSVVTNQRNATWLTIKFHNFPGLENEIWNSMAS